MTQRHWSMDSKVQIVCTWYASPRIYRLDIKRVIFYVRQLWKFKKSEKKEWINNMKKKLKPLGPPICRLGLEKPWYWAMRHPSSVFSWHIVCANWESVDGDPSTEAKSWSACKLLQPTEPSQMSSMKECYNIIAKACHYKISNLKRLEISLDKWNVGRVSSLGAN